MIEEPSASCRGGYRLTLPVRCRPIPEVCVHARAGAGTMMLVVGALVMIAELHERNEPVPVQQGHVVVEIGRGVPAQEMIVIDADFAGRVVVADVVIVGLRQRYVDDAENQDADSQGSCPSPDQPAAATPRFRLVLGSNEGRLCQPWSGKRPYRADESFRITQIL